MTRRKPLATVFLCIDERTTYHNGENKLTYWIVLREKLPVSVTAVSVGVEVYSQLLYSVNSDQF